MTWDRKVNINHSVSPSLSLSLALALSLSLHHFPYISPSLDPLGHIDIPLFVILIRSTLSKYPFIHAYIGFYL